MTQPRTAPPWVAKLVGAMVTAGLWTLVDNGLSIKIRSASESGKPEPRKRKALSPRLRFAVLQRDGFRCVYCGAGVDSSRLHIDHVLAVANGGVNAIHNLVTACEECNEGKSNSTMDEGILK